MYSRSERHLKKKRLQRKQQQTVLAIASMGLMMAFTKVSVNTEADVLKTSTAAVSTDTSDSQAQVVETAAPAATEDEAAPVAETPAETVVEETTYVAEEPAQEVVAETTYADTSSQADYSYQGTQTTAATGSYTLSNGNTAGEVGSAAAAQMAAATGVSQSTWEYIIARESNGNASASNASGASGLFQTMPGWGSTATVQDQVNSAINAYNSQGLSAWGM